MSCLGWSPLTELTDSTSGDHVLYSRSLLGNKELPNVQEIGRVLPLVQEINNKAFHCSSLHCYPQCIRNVKYPGSWVQKIRQGYVKIYFREKSGRTLCSLSNLATQPLALSPSMPCPNPHLPRPCFASLELHSTFLGGSSAEDGSLCWEWNTAKGKSESHRTLEWLGLEGT